MSRGDDFYVGYRRQAPPGVARFLRPLVVALVLLAAALAAALAALQAPFDPGVFEFGTVRELEGTVAERPHPHLLVERPGVDAGISRFHLVAEGKRGAGREIAGLDGRRVRLAGTLVHRQGETMIEVVSGSVEPLVPAGARGDGPVDLGTWTLRGEIVDSKCFLGVMKPGRGKPHRGCATRCLSGGVPPILRVETAGGEFRHLLFTGPDGEVVNERLLPFVAEPVEVTGRLLASGDWWLLRADPSAIRRLGAP